jgi:hypothetical protein
MKQAVIFVPHCTGEWLEAALDLHSKLEAANLTVRIFDLSSFSFPRRIDIDSKHILRIHPVFESLSRPGRADKKVLDKSINLEDLDSTCEQAIKSLSRMEDPAKYSPVLHFTRKLMVSRAIALWQALWANFSTFRLMEAVYIPNGRFPVDKVLIQFFEQMEVDLKFWEMNASHTGYFITDWQIHDWTKSKPSVLQYVESHLGDDEKATWAVRWIEERQAKSSNPFAKFWASNSELEMKNLEPDEKLAVFYTSSSDELGAVPAREVVQLSHQHSAVRILAQALLSTKYRLVIRIHPNLANKPLAQFFRELRAYRKIAKDFEHVRLIPPWSKINSYELLRRAEFVLVHGSTIGIEASALGKSVITTQRTAYSEITDVVEILSSHDLPKLLLGQAPVDSRKALIYIEYINRHRIIVPRYRAELRNSSNKKLITGLKILIRNPLDSIFAIWFNYKWICTSLVIKLITGLPYRQ